MQRHRGRKIARRAWEGALERSRSVCILRLDDDVVGDERAFIVGDRTVTLGRAPDSDIVIPEESVSRHHARFSRVDDGWRITDLGSKNGLRVNTFKVEEQRLRDGDRIDLGTVRLHVEIGPAPASQRANVVFRSDGERGMHTEVLEMSGLSSLLSSVSESIPPVAEVSELDEAAESDFEAKRATNAKLLQLVSGCAQALISCDSLDETLDRILALVFDNLPAERGVICLYDEATDSTLPKVMRTREGIPDQPITISTNISNDVVHRKQALLVRDTQLDDRFGGAESVIMMEIHSAMCVPLLRDERVNGFIYVDQQSGNERFESPHLHALSTLAMLSAIAVEQAGLRDRVRHEQSMRARLARYSSPAVVDRILQASGAADQKMVAEESEVSILFADLTGFTAMAENLRSSDTIRILNRVFEELTHKVFEMDGTLDKFRGDGMMAFFGAPLPMPDHAERAVEAALRMLEALDALNERRSGGQALQMRIGVNSGTVVVGDIGSPQRKDYTVIGDTVNIASRLESEIARPGQVVVGYDTWEQVQHKIIGEELPEVQLKGKRRRVRPVLIVGRSKDAPPKPPTAPTAFGVREV